MSHHMVAITELDLSNCRPNSITDRINDVPGLKTSTAFFTFLRANLVQPSSAMSSRVNTPLLEPQTTISPGRQLQDDDDDAVATTSSYSPANPSRQGTAKTGPGRPPKAGGGRAAPSTLADDDDIPPFSLEVLTERADRVEALRLVADSVAQQRQRAALSLVLHPACLAGLALALAAAHQVAWARGGRRDAGLLLTLASGVVMSYLVAVRLFASRYIALAEGVGWRFLSRFSTGIQPPAAADDAPVPDGSDLATEDVVLGARFGEELVAALVLRLEPLGRPASSSGGGGGSGVGGGSSGGGGRRKHRTSSLKGGRGVIRAWTTKLRYRCKGVGGDMLREAVRVTRERCGRDAEVGFAKEHANSVMVLPEMFNGPFRKTERKATKALEAILVEFEGTRRKK